MSLNSENLNKLNNIKRQLPKLIEIPTQKKQIQHKTNSKLHPIETENNPEKLFRELMKASNDGNIPPHLINRLRHLENIPSDNEKQIEKKHTAKRDKKDISSDIDEKNLYTSFKRLLLEDED